LRISRILAFISSLFLGLGVPSVYGNFRPDRGAFSILKYVSIYAGTLFVFFVTYTLARSSITHLSNPFIRRSAVVMNAKNACHLLFAQQQNHTTVHFYREGKRKRRLQTLTRVIVTTRSQTNLSLMPLP